ncbi:transcriptional regulator [Massilia sp. CCM 8734]|uniref:helix-turn-helix domain-containing protein n=1 Tax=Massilia sp. CCM 8734 TaxID=2609283 RepID=UPI00141DA163|nr:transcriptional regulator [Massilia sp. CCM 8734]NHZ97488.1 transcriptional regulator [Massilia sp. CCM 8734]
METLMDRAAVDTITSHFRALTSLVPLNPIRSEQDYDKAVAVLNQLLDAGAADERHALADLASMLGTLIAVYDDAHYPATPVSPLTMLRFLMDQHQVTESALPELGSQTTVTAILNGTRELDIRQIKALAARFQVPATLFL